MSDKKRICLLGFAQEAEQKIKNIIQKNAGSQTVEWGPANDKNLDGVVINASFLEAPQIQKYIGIVKCPIVCAHANAEGANLASRSQFHSIAWADERADAQLWTATLMGETIADPIVKTETVNQTQTAKTPNKTASHMSADANGDILKKIRRSENVVLHAINGDNSTWIKPAEGLVYINYPREKVPGYDLWKWEEVKTNEITNEIPASARQLRIDVWLFETLWQSHLDGAEHINKNAHFRLLRWPQPLGRNGRTEALRLVACAQSFPVDIKMLQEKTNYPLEQINRFLFASISSGYVEEVIGPVKQTVAQRSQMDEAEKREKRSLLQRFRAKLGL